MPISGREQAARRARKTALEFARGADTLALISTADSFTAIADANRRHLLEELRRGPKSVNQLAGGLPVSRPAVSQHLKVLLDAGLVVARPNGTQRVYALKPGGFTQLNIWVDQFWSS